MTDVVILEKDKLIQVFNLLRPVLPNAPHYIKHLEQDESRHDKVNSLIYTSYLESEDFTKELQNG